jgi:hypothetical protein
VRNFPENHPLLGVKIGNVKRILEKEKLKKNWVGFEPTLLSPQQVGSAT